MRRLLSLVLLLVFGLPTVAPALGFSADSASSLPACCRRNGAHQCALSPAEIEAMQRGTRISILRSKCPCCPTAPTQFEHLSLSTPQGPSTLAAFVEHPLPISQVEAWARASEAGARHKRGPPPVSLS